MNESWKADRTTSSQVPKQIDAEVDAFREGKPKDDSPHGTERVDSSSIAKGEAPEAASDVTTPVSRLPDTPESAVPCDTTTPLGAAEASGAAVFSEAWMKAFFIRCLRYFGDCRASPKLAFEIAAADVGEDDSWPHRLNFELSEYFASVSPRNNFSSTTIKCSRAGCLVYFTAHHAQAFGTNSADIGPFWRALNAQPWATEFGEVVDSRSGTRAHAAGFFSPIRQFGMLIVLPRPRFADN